MPRRKSLRNRRNTLRRYRNGKGGITRYKWLKRTLPSHKTTSRSPVSVSIDDAMRNALPLIHRHINHYGIEEEWELTGTTWRLRKTRSATGQRDTDTPTVPTERGRMRSPRRRSRPQSIHGLRSRSPSWTYSTPRSGSRARRSSYR